MKLQVFLNEFIDFKVIRMVHNARRIPENCIFVAKFAKEN
jgi:hypothetical protein